jgi:hypothetical protein
MAIAAACDSIPLKDIRQELERVLKSRVFRQSLRLCEFLRFAVECTIEGKGNLLKEYVIGCEVYHRKPPYDPTQDSIVRSEASRLRAKLKQYYESEGRYDLVRIHFEVGRYVPSFIRCPSIEPARDLAETPLSAGFTGGLSEEIAHVLMRRGLRSVIAGHSPEGPGEAISMWPDFRFEGSIREQEGEISVMVRLIRADRVQTASSRC